MVTRVTVLVLTTLFILLMQAKVFSEPTQIKGHAPGAEGMKVELHAYDDFISNKQVLLNKALIGQDGSFEITQKLNTTTFVYLKIGLQKAELLFEPGRNYHLQITGLLDENLQMADIPHFQLPPLLIKIIEPWRHELNGLVRDFFIFHENFITENAAALLIQRSPGIAGHYASQLYDEFPGIDNFWFNEMLTWKIAAIEMMARAKGRETIARDYLLEHEVLYNHMIYMDFFNQFWDKYLITSRLYNRSELIETLNSSDSYSLMMEMLGKDPILSGNRLRELVLIRSLKDLHGLVGFSQRAIIRLLEEVQKKSEYAEHRKIAGNLRGQIGQN